MPFADCGSAIAGLIEEPGEGVFVGPQAGDVPGGLGWKGSEDAGTFGVLAGEDGGARGGADRSIGVPLSEADARGGQPVQVGSADFGMALAAEVADALVVGDDDEEVGAAGRAWPGGWGLREEGVGSAGRAKAQQVAAVDWWVHGLLSM